MGDTSETNTKVLSRELFLGVVALKRLYQKIIICATRTLFSGTVTYSECGLVDVCTYLLRELLVLRISLFKFSKKYKF